MAILVWVMVGGCALLLSLVLLTVNVVHWGVRTGMPPYPSTRGERHAVVELLREVSIAPGVIYELGCGFGGMARTLARAFPGHRIEAVEISPAVAFCAKVFGLGLSNLHIRRGDFMDVQLAEAAAVVCYLLRSTNQRLAMKLDGELVARTPVISVVFGFPERQVHVRRRSLGRRSGDILLYRWPGSD
ncbi:MAG: class I SAM-dependent methyltransferase [Myxococcota bacterium]